MCSRSSPLIIFQSEWRFKSDYSLLKQWGQRRSIRSKYQTVENDENTAIKAFWCVIFLSLSLKKGKTIIFTFDIWIILRYFALRNFYIIISSIAFRAKGQWISIQTFLYVHFYNGHGKQWTLCNWHQRFIQVFIMSYVPLSFFWFFGQLQLFSVCLV